MKIAKNKINIKIDSQPESGLSAFVERPVPSDQEITSFEKVVDREAKHQEIDSNLEAIYRDKKGGMVNVKRLNIKKGAHFMVRLFRKLFLAFVLLAGIYFIYLYFFTGGNDITAVTFNISAPEKVTAGEEFSYRISYNNVTKFNIANIKLELKYPENFIFIDSSVAPERTNANFNLPDLAAGSEGILEIKGMIIGRQDSVNIISGRLNYTPVNYSSEFKREASESIVVSGIGFTANTDYSNLFYINQENEISFSFSGVDNYYLENFFIKFLLPDTTTIDFPTATKEEKLESENKEVVVEESGDGYYSISNLNKDSSNKKISFNFYTKDKPETNIITIRLEKRLPDGQSYIFWEKTINPEIVKSDLNLTMTLVDPKTSNSVNFNDTLNYVLTYSNQGDNVFKDATIMVVLDGEVYNWNSLVLEDSGEIRTGKMIVWNKQGIADLSEISPGDQGEIKFSIKLNDYQESYFGQDLAVTTYAQYGAGEQTISENNKSNILTSKINSDLKIVEQIRYFNENNTPVGSGPLPPRVGEASSFKVYWQISNNLHELNQTEVSVSLPNYVNWSGDVVASAGSLYYDNYLHAVIWKIGRLPLSVYQVDASFMISLTPNENDRNKILILTPGAEATAIDTETQAVLTKTSAAKTTKLEDDDIASLNNSGKIE